MDGYKKLVKTVLRDCLKLKKYTTSFLAVKVKMYKKIFIGFILQLQKEQLIFINYSAV